MKTKTARKTTPHAPGTYAFYVEIYQRTLPRLAALTPARLSMMNVDVPQAMVTLRVALPALATMRPVLEAKLRDFDFVRFDQLADDARMLEFTHAQYLAVTAMTDELPALHAKATRVLDTLYVSANALAARGLLAAEGLDELRACKSFVETVAHLRALATRLRNAWATIEHRTAVTLTELDEAEVLAEGVADALAKREQRDERLAKAADERRRAFTLVDEAYTDARRALQYARFYEGDADEIAPSLRTYDGSSRRKPASTTETKGAPGAKTDPKAPVVTPKDETNTAVAKPQEGSRVGRPTPDQSSPYLESPDARG